MERSIWIFGHGDKSKEGIPNAEYMVKWIRDEIFNVDKGRYHHTQIKDADVVVLCQDRLLYGHFELAARVPVTNWDRQRYSKVRAVYPVRKSALYEIAIPLSDVGYDSLGFFRKLTEDQFRRIQTLAGKITHFNDKGPIANSADYCASCG